MIVTTMSDCAEVCRCAIEPGDEKAIILQNHRMNFLYVTYNHSGLIIVMNS